MKTPILTLVTTFTALLALAEDPPAQSVTSLAQPTQVEGSKLAQVTTPNLQIDYPAFLGISAEVQAYREKRRISVERFLEMAKEPDTIILDTRSRLRYDEKHIKGAVHLNFSDMTKEDLARVIPDKATRILIYCNNNFTNNSPSFVMKGAELALNIPTFINLYGYGYKNIYELGPTVDEANTVIEFEGTAVK